MASSILDTEAGNDRCVPAGSRKERDGSSRDGYRRPTAAEYASLRLRGVSKIEALLTMVKVIDERLDDAARQFDRYQMRTHGSITVSYKEKDGILHPYLVRFLIARDNARVVVQTMTDEHVRGWTVALWRKEHKNPGFVFKSALGGVHDAILLRRDLMAGLTGRPVTGVEHLRRRTEAVGRRLDRQLDSLTRALVTDWSARNQAAGRAQ